MNGLNKAITITTVLFLCMTSISVIAKEKTELVFRAQDKPWLTNEAYLDDEYSVARAKAFKKQKSSNDKVADKECMTEKGRPDIWCTSEKLSKFRKAFDKKNPERGSVRYVLKKYGYIKEDIKKHGKDLKAALASLDELSLRTRSVSVYEKKEFGELTYEEVRREICLIEENIGYFPRKRYCKRY